MSETVMAPIIDRIPNKTWCQACKDWHQTWEGCPAVVYMILGLFIHEEPIEAIQRCYM